MDHLIATGIALGAIPMCGALYWAGGQDFNGPDTPGGGWKGWRRFVLPGWVALVATSLGNPLAGLVAAALLCTVCHLGYGETSRLTRALQGRQWLSYTVIGLGLSLSTLPLHCGPTTLLPLLAHGALGSLSLRYNAVNWAWVAWATGLSIGAASFLPSR